MALTQLAPPYPVFSDLNGDPLDAGYIYIGTADRNPEASPIPIYFDEALTQPAAQPLRTTNGYIMRNGSPAVIYAATEFSVTIRNKQMALVLYAPNSFGVNLTESPTRTAETAAAFSALADGSIFEMDGLQYETDSTVILADSATADLGVAGIKRLTAGTLSQFGYFPGVSGDVETAFSRAANSEGIIDLGPGDFTLNTQLVLDVNNSGLLVRGAGKGYNQTKIITDCAGDAGILFDGAQHCTFQSMTIQGNDVSAPLVQMGAGGGVTFANLFEGIRFQGNSGGGRPLITDTAHVAVRGIEATGGNANYFHRFTNCDFDSLYAGFHADFNANAWFVNDAKLQGVWRCFRGGFQQWMVNNTFWHSSAGIGLDVSIFLELFGKSGTNKSQYNLFANTQAEPGAVLTQYLSLDVNTQSNSLEGDHQCTTQGTDLGTNNHIMRPIIGRQETGSNWTWGYTGPMVVGATGGTGGLSYFGNGTTSQTGTARKLTIHGGQTAETRRGSVFQQPGGNFTIEALVAGNIELKTAASVNQTVVMSGLPIYADNAAAVSGGLPLGAIYSTATGEVRVRV